MLKKLARIFVLFWLIANRQIFSATIDCNSFFKNSKNSSSICIQDNHFRVQTSVGKTPPRPLLPTKQKAINWFVDQNSSIRLNMTWMQNKNQIPEGYHIQIWHEELAIMYRFNINFKVNINQIDGDNLSDVIYFNYNCFGSSDIWEIVTQFRPSRKNKKYYLGRIYSLPMYAEGNDDLYLKVNISMPNCCKKVFRHSRNCQDHKFKKSCSNRRRKKRHKHVNTDVNAKTKTAHAKENPKRLTKYENIEYSKVGGVVTVVIAISITVTIYTVVILYLKCYKGRRLADNPRQVMFVMNHLSADTDMYHKADAIVADLQKHMSLIAVCSWQQKEEIAVHGLHQWFLNKNTECDRIVLLCFGNYSNNVFRICIENVGQCNKVILCCTSKNHNCVEIRHKYQKVSQQHLKKNLCILVEKYN